MASRVNQMKRLAFLISKKVRRWNKEDCAHKDVRNERITICFNCKHRARYDCSIDREFIPHKANLNFAKCPLVEPKWDVTIV
jgi:hypothetical protein